MVREQLKKIFSHTLVYGIGNILNRFLGFILLPVYTHFYNPAQFGVFSLVYALWFFAAVFYLFGMETSFQKFFVEAKTSDGQKKIFGSTLILISATSIIFSTVIFFNSGFISRLVTGNESNFHLIKLLAVLLIIDALSRFPMIVLNALQKSRLYTVINISSVIINIFFNFLFIVIKHLGIESIFYAFIISYSYQLVISFFVCIKYFSFKVDKEQVRVLARFAVSFLFYGLFLISLDLVDRFLLGYYKGEETVGIYSACYRIGMAMNLVISGFRTAWIPFFLNLKEKSDNKIIFSRVFTYFVYGAVLFFLAIALFAPDIIRIRIGNFSLLDEKYWSGMVIVPYILLAYLFFGLYTNLNIASYFENKISFLIISTGVGCVSNIIFNIILIPLYSITGAAIATLLSYFLMFAVLYILSQKVYFIKYEWLKIIFVFALTIGIFLFNIYFSDIFFGVITKLYFVYFAKIISILVLGIVIYILSHKTSKTSIS